jgi:hypothetical protein
LAKNDTVMMKAAVAATNTTTNNNNNIPTPLAILFVTLYSAK